MKILVTGSAGFVGKNLVIELKNRGYQDICEYDTDTAPSFLEDYCREADFVFHLAGINRSPRHTDFMEGNTGFTALVLENLKKHKNPCPVVNTSSIQASLNTPYGRSKRLAETLLCDHGRETGAKVLIYRLPNVFGKWSRPNYNSVIATFCYNISRNLPIKINNPDTVMNLVYIDDVVDEFISAIDGKEHKDGSFCSVPLAYTVTLGEIANTINSFNKSREQRSVPNMGDAFTKKLYSTYLSYLSKDNFRYGLKMNADKRGSFTEFIKTPDRGQVSINVSKPGVTKGNHWHHTKAEKFLVVSGKGVIRFRDVYSGEVIEYFVDGSRMEALDIPPGYTHNIENLGDVDMVTVMWANEPFNSEQPDTFHLEV